jgi:hypothetical protein
MEQSDLLKILLKTNSSSLQPINEQVLKDILKLVVQYPLDDDREKCQEEIKKVLARQSPGCVPQ